MTKAPKKIWPEGAIALQSAVLRNGEAQAKGSKFISGFVGSNEDRQKILSYFDDTAFVVRTDSRVTHYSMKKKLFVTSPSSDAVAVFGFRITPKSGLIDISKFQKNYDATVHILSALEGDLSGPTKSYEDALFEMAVKLKGNGGLSLT